MVTANNIAAFLGKLLHGKDIEIAQPCTINNVKKGGVLFANRYSEQVVKVTTECSDILLIAHPEYHNRVACSYILSENPRLDYALLLEYYFAEETAAGIASTAVLGRNVALGKEVTIGQHTVIGDNVTIGEGSIIGHNVTILDNVRLGIECTIKSNTVIGEKGFGFERNKDGVPVRIPHLGGVFIGNNVEIGSLNTVVRGTIDNTVIEDNVKTDDHVHIAHNVHIEKNCLITACSTISGSVRIREKSWLGPNCSIINNITVGKNVFIGLGAVVTKSVPDSVVVAGNPAKILRKNL